MQRKKDGNRPDAATKSQLLRWLTTDQGFAAPDP